MLSNPQMGPQAILGARFCHILDAIAEVVVTSFDQDVSDYD